MTRIPPTIPLASPVEMSTSPLDASFESESDTQAFAVAILILPLPLASPCTAAVEISTCPLICPLPPLPPLLPSASTVLLLLVPGWMIMSPDFPDAESPLLIWILPVLAGPSPEVSRMPPLVAWPTSCSCETSADEVKFEPLPAENPLLSLSNTRAPPFAEELAPLAVIPEP